MRLGIFATIAVALLLGAGAAWAEEDSPPAAQPPEPVAVEALPTAQAPAPASTFDLDIESVYKRERAWNGILSLAHAKNADPAQLRRFLTRYLEFFPQTDDPHRALALYLIEQLDAKRPLQRLSFFLPKPPPPPLPLNGLDPFFLRLHMGRAFGFELGMIGLRQGYFAADLFHFTLLCPYIPGLITDLGTSLGARLPLGKQGRNELRFLAGVSWVGVQILAPMSSDEDGSVEGNTFTSDLGVSIELSYVLRYSKALALQIGMKSLVLTITHHGYFMATGFVGIVL